MSVQISLIVPFLAPAGSERAAHWAWLKEYYVHELPGAEIVMGTSKGDIFSKTRAINNGVRKSSGRILAIVDADAYIDGSVIQECADRLEATLGRGQRRWFVPYRRLYRLHTGITEQILASSPQEPLRLPSPPLMHDVESTAGSLHGRRFGAMMVIYPREAFDIIGGMDPRFEGWGGEDIAFARALDTLYAKHKSVDADILHLWHPKIGDDILTRTWEGQDGTQRNGALASRYGHAAGDILKMRELVDEGIQWGQEQKLLYQARKRAEEAVAAALAAALWLAEWIKQFASGWGRG